MLNQFFTNSPLARKKTGSPNCPKNIELCKELVGKDSECKDNFFEIPNCLIEKIEHTPSTPNNMQLSNISTYLHVT